MWLTKIFIDVNIDDVTESVDQFGLIGILDAAPVCKEDWTVIVGLSLGCRAEDWRLSNHVHHRSTDRAGLFWTAAQPGACLLDMVNSVHFYTIQADAVYMDRIR